MKTYQLKQAFRLGGERFDIKTQDGQVDYRVEGSFLKVPKTFTIFAADGQEIARMGRQVLSILPKFQVTLADGQSFSLQKRLSFWKDRYEFNELPLVIEGNILDMDFLLKDEDGHLVAQISKEFFRLTSTYQLTIWDEVYTDLVVALAVAIDYVDLLENRS